MLKKNWAFIYTVFVFLFDITLFNLAFRFAIYLRFPDLKDISMYYEPWLFVNILFVVLIISLGVYRDFMQNTRDVNVLNQRKLAFYLALITMSALFLVKGHEYSRGVIVIFILTQYFLIDFGNAILLNLNKRLLSKGFGKRNTVIVGVDEMAKEFGEKLKNIFGDYYHIIGHMENGRLTEPDPTLENFTIGKLENLEHMYNDLNIEQIFIVSSSMSFQKYEKVRQFCQSKNIKLKMVSHIIYDLMGNAKVKDVTGVPLSTIQGRYRFEKFQCITKRTLDLVLLAVSSVFLLPAGFIIALLIRLTSPGPVFFKQKRALYKGGKEFLFYKFRTMYNNADEIKGKLLNENESNGALFKMKNDPRITPVGRFLRKYSLDEIPQFINVLKGDMSIVGPRPLPLKDFDMIKNDKINYDWYEKRGETKPGITGLWQISGRSDLTFEEMCLLDLYYIENKSVFFDLEIMFETVPVVLFGKGAY